MCMNTIAKVFKLNVQVYAVYHLLSFIGTFIFFHVAVFMIMTLAKPDTYINISASIAGIVFFIISLIIGIVNFTSGHSNTIKHGVSRKNYIVGILTYHAVASVCFLLLMLIAQTEGYINNYLYGGFSVLEVDQVLPSVYNNPLFYIAVPLIIFLVSAMFGTVILKFGLQAATLMYSITLLLLAAFNSNYEKAKAFINNSILMDISPTIIIIFFILLITVALTFSIKFYLKHNVN